VDLVRPSFARETITRLRYPLVDDHGTARVDYDSPPAEDPVDRCWLEPTGSQEVGDGRAAVLTGYTVDAPWEADITAADRVRYGGVLFDVDGQPLKVPSPTGALRSTRLALRVWEG
jgi:hypothetical protein